MSLESLSITNIQLETSGFCRTCGRKHSLAVGAARQAAVQLMLELESRERIDLEQSDLEADPVFSTDYLFSRARGKMFGVMTAATPDGSTVSVRAFSGQYNGVWQVPGWVGPVFDLADFHRVHDAQDQGTRNRIRKTEKTYSSAQTSVTKTDA